MIDRRRLLAAAPAFAALAAGPAWAGPGGGVVVLDALDPATPAKLHELARTRGLLAVRFTGPVAEDYCESWLDSGAAQKAWAAASELKLRVELPNGPAARIQMLAERFPRCRVSMI